MPSKQESIPHSSSGPPPESRTAPESGSASLDRTSQGPSSPGPLPFPSTIPRSSHTSCGNVCSLPTASAQQMFTLNPEGVRKAGHGQESGGGIMSRNTETHPPELEPTTSALPLSLSKGWVLQSLILPRRSTTQTQDYTLASNGRQTPGTRPGHSRFCPNLHLSFTPRCISPFPSTLSVDQGDSFLRDELRIGGISGIH